MPPQSRSQRRRQATRQPGRGSPPPTASRATSANPATLNSENEAPEPRAVRQQTRRVVSRFTPEPVDYSKDYSAVRRDLRWIALWTLLLFVGMIALKFSGLV